LAIAIAIALAIMRWGTLSGLRAGPTRGAEIGASPEGLPAGVVEVDAS
jgi:hypothetical protein